MQKTLETLKSLIVVTGHFGSGKTNFSVNLAKKFARDGKPVTIVDLDIVNLYFRAADNRAELEELGIRCIVPDFANTNVDIPSLPPSILGALETSKREPDRYTILDVGGDNGAIALGMYNRFFTEGQYEMLYVANKYRPLTETVNDAEAVLREIEWAGRLKATGLVHNSNLGVETTADDVSDALLWAEELSKKCGLPLVCTCAFEALRSELPQDGMFYMENATKQIY